MEPVDQEYAPDRAGSTLPPGSTPSAAYVGITHAQERAGRLNTRHILPRSVDTGCTSTSRLWLHSANRVGTDIASTSVTQRRHCRMTNAEGSRRGAENRRDERTFPRAHTSILRLCSVNSASRLKVANEVP